MFSAGGPARLGPRKPFGCGFTFEVKFGVINASEVLSENKIEVGRFYLRDFTTYSRQMKSSQAKTFALPNQRNFVAF